MKTKKWIKAGMLLMVAALFAACANEDIAQDKKKENGTEAPKGGVIFAANGPKTSAKRLSIGDEDESAGAKTRTNLKHTPGNGADAYWTSGDFIWVWDKNGMFQSSTHTEIHDGGASAEFTLPGSMTDYADGCEVWYTKGGYAIIHPTAVFFSNDKQITAPNDFSIVGGDCGSGKAYATGNPAKFNFRISHKATYLCFLPRCENAALAPNIRLTKIRLTATKCYNNPSYPLCDLYVFDGETIGPNSGYNPYNTMTMEVSDFPLFTTANQEANAVCTIIRPDTYDFKIEYTIKDPTTNIETVITQTLTNKTFDKGKIYDITANLSPAMLKYCMWDAKYDYWYNHLKADGTPDGNYAQNNTDQRWYHEGSGAIGATESCKDCPNANELFWYIFRGDAHWSTENVVRVENGHLKQIMTNGIWLKKKAKIMADEGITEEQMKSGYPKSNPKDMRTTHPMLNNGPLTVGPAPNTNDYFFLPITGYYYAGTFYNATDLGCYWSSSALPWDPSGAYLLLFSSSRITWGQYQRNSGLSVIAFE